MFPSPVIHVKQVQMMNIKCQSEQTPQRGGVGCNSDPNGQNDLEFCIQGSFLHLF